MFSLTEHLQHFSGNTWMKNKCFDIMTGGGYKGIYDSAVKSLPTRQACLPVEARLWAAPRYEPICPAGGSLCQNSERQKPTLIDEHVVGEGFHADCGSVKRVTIRESPLTSKSYIEPAAVRGKRHTGNGEL